MINNAPVIIQSADIVSTIQKFVELKRSGPNYTGHSPFNANDKTPSFVVSPRKQIYKCFSTGKGGDVVSFLMEHKHLTFVEAVEYLAADSNIIIEYSQGANRELEIAKERENKEIRKHLYDVMLKVHDSYSSPSNQNDNRDAAVSTGGLIQIAGKSYTPDIVAKWGMKTAGDYNHLSDISRSWSTEDRSAIIDMGIIKANKKGDAHYDFFHHRLLFPLVDDRGHLVGYNGRITEAYPPPKDDGKKPPKYINSQESLIFNKSTFLFGYHQNFRNIRDRGFVYIVEGSTDVIMMDQAGMNNALACSGTSFSDYQAKLIARITDTAIIINDGDIAGLKSLEPKVSKLLKAGVETKTVILPDGMDPADMATAPPVVIKNRDELIESISLFDVIKNKCELTFKKTHYSAVSPFDYDNDESSIKYIASTSKYTCATTGKSGNTVLQFLQHLDMPESDIYTYLSQLTGIEIEYETFRDYVNKNTEDAIEYIVRSNIGKDPSPKLLRESELIAAKFAADIADKNIRDLYADSLAKICRTTKAVMMQLIETEVESRMEMKSKLTPEQEQQKNAWGLYIRDNKYIDWNGTELSNFIVRPLFLIHYRGQANRVFEINNKYGVSKILNVESNAFTKLSSFREETERGNFIWKGNEAQYTKVREWIYNEMKDVKAIEVLGYQTSTGIYAWANGITIPGTDTVLEVDDYGLVEYKTDKDTTTYYLPAMSKVNLSTDEDTDNELETHFIYNTPPSGTRAPRDVKGWAEAFATLFGENAAIGMAWTFSTVYRDILHRRYDMFPHLNLFGPKGSGKTFMGDVIAAIFGKPMRPIHLVSSSPVAFYRRIAQTRNAIVRYEEYSEKVPGDKQEALKNFADGFGRVTGQMTNNNKTKSTPVLNSCIITGQVLPTQEPALLQRLISLYFGSYMGTKKSQQFGEQFKEWGKAGYFAFVTVELHKHRDYIEDRFADKMEYVRDYLRTVFVKRQPEDRVLNNFAMIASIYMLLSDKIRLPFTDVQILDAIVSRIEEQSRVVEGADELSGFWKVIEYLVNQEKEKQGMGLSADYYAVEFCRALTVKVTETDTRIVELDRVKEYDGTERDAKVIFIRMNYAHSLYSTKGEKMVNRIVDKNTLLHYMSQHKSYIGEIKAKKINGKPQRVYAFNLEHLSSFEFEPTNWQTKEKESTKEFVNPDYDVNSGMTPPYISTDMEIPF